MSDTPRTDNESEMHPDATTINGRFEFMGRATEKVSAEFARQLERELAAANARIAELEKTIRAFAE